nr:hypothetical protein [Cerasicoccus maritimus]
MLKLSVWTNGCAEGCACASGRTGSGPERVGLWRLSRNSLVCQALNDQHLKNQGVPSLRDLWVVFKYGEKAKT